MTRGRGVAVSASLALLATVLLTGAGGWPAMAAEAVGDDDEEAQSREVYVPHPEFRTYLDLDQLAVER